MSEDMDEKKWTFEDIPIKKRNPEPKPRQLPTPVTLINSTQPVSSWTPASWSEDQIQLLKDTFCKDLTNDEFKLFCYACKRTGLDPFMRQIYAVKRWNKSLNRKVMIIQVGIDGYRLVAERTGAYAGSDDPIIDDDQTPNKAMVTVYKFVGGQRCPFTASARWSEYYPGEELGFMWKRLPCLMLGKVAEALALRKAFPAELSGIYTDEEMRQADRDQLPRITPGEPGPEDGVPYPYQDYRVPGGKYVKRGLHEIDPYALRAYIQFIEERLLKFPEKKTDWWDDFVHRAEQFLGELENRAEATEEVEEDQ